MPSARLPDDPATPAPADWYSPEELEAFRLSSKNHVDVPILVGERPVHLLASHPRRASTARRTTTASATFPLVGTFDRRFTNGFASSDHRLVRVDLAVPGAGRHRAG